MAKAIKFTMDAKLGSTARQFATVGKEVIKTEGALKKMGRAGGQVSDNMDRVNKSMRRGQRGTERFGGALSQMKSTLMSLVGIGGGLMLMRQVLGQISEEARTAATSITESYDAMVRMVQVTTSKEDLQRALLVNELAALRGGLRIPAAHELGFQALSFAGVREKDLFEIAQSQRFTGTGGPLAMLRGVGKIKAAGAYGEQAGTAGQLMSGFLAGGGPSDILSQQIAEAVILSMPAARGIGTGLPELIGLISALTPSGASYRETATGIRGLSMLLGREKYGGEGIVAGLERFRAEKPERLKEVLLANVRAQMGASGIIASGALIPERIAEVEDAIRTGTRFAEAIERSKIPRLTRVHKLRQIEIAEQLQDQQLGGEEIEFQALQKAVQVLLKEDLDVSPISRMLVRQVHNMYRLFGGPKAGIRSIEGDFGLDTDQMLDAVITITEERLEKQMNATIDIRDDARKRDRTQPLATGGNAGREDSNYVE